MNLEGRHILATLHVLDDLQELNTLHALDDLKELERATRVARSAPEPSGVDYTSRRKARQRARKRPKRRRTTSPEKIRRPRSFVLFREL